MAVSKKSKRAQNQQAPDAEAFAALLDTHDPIVVARAFRQARDDWRKAGGQDPPIMSGDIVQERPEVGEPSPVSRLIRAGRDAMFKEDQCPCSSSSTAKSATAIARAAVARAERVDRHAERDAEHHRITTESLVVRREDPAVLKARLAERRRRKTIGE